MSLEEYNRKRNFKDTPEPKGTIKMHPGALRFVVQKHAASHLHYDFRLEAEGVLKSWAIPKGPSMNPADKRLAVQVEDHPFDYRTFEGTIPEGNYGAGSVIVWDEGIYKASNSSNREESEQAILAGLENGQISFILNGQKLRGEFSLRQMKRDGKKEWLLIKKKDEFATHEDVTLQDTSVISGQTVEEIGKGIKKKSPHKKEA